MRRWRRRPGRSRAAGLLKVEAPMPGGRPPKGPRLVEGLEGSQGAKAKLKVILETITGEVTIGEACEDLGLKEAMVHVLRKQALEGALGALEPKPLGRPRKEVEAVSTEGEKLQREVAELRRKLRSAEIKVELEASIHSLGKRVKDAEKKTKGKL